MTASSIHQAYPSILPSFADAREPSDHEHAIENEHAMALLALSHTPIEHSIYRAMLAHTVATKTHVGVFSIRHLMTLTGAPSYSTVRRSCAGLLSKMSVECYNIGNNCQSLQKGITYRVFSPEEIFARRRAVGLAPYPREVQAYKKTMSFEENMNFGHAVERVVERHSLSRRQAHVALCCAEGLTNAQIGERLCISEETVKFHLRHIFVKFGVKRRTELVSRLLMHSGPESGQ